MRVAELGGARGDDDVCRERKLQSASIAMPADAGDDRLRQFGQRLNGLRLEMRFRRALALLDVLQIVAG